jgi:class 3 adenylate cyclase/tetratricopeptide (TPR) repeat protein
MAENKTRRAGSTSSSLEEVFRERERLDHILEQKFRKKVAVLFTDICGYTEYVDKKGDINGRALLMKHNRIVLPLIEKHEGKVIEIIGDAVMASFSSAPAAVKASIAVQRALYEHNQKAEAADRIHVKMGINLGEALVDDSAVYQSLTGDVANVASRIQSESGPDQILISKAVYEQLDRSMDTLCLFHGKIRVKGKAQPLEVYRVIWQDEDVVPDGAQNLRVHEALARKGGKQPLKLLEIEIGREGDHLKLSAHEQMPGEETTIRHYEEIPVAIDVIQAKYRDMVDTLNKANREGRLSREVLAKLRERGQVLHDELFSLAVKEKLRNTEAEYLILKIDDQLVHIPWELLHDGQHFLCQRFSMGRLVKTRQTVMNGRSRQLARPLKMLILADPQGDLKGAYAEGTRIRDDMDHHKDWINASLRSGKITPDAIREKIRNFDFVHFAGHADYNPQNAADSGWRLTGGSLKAKDVTKMAGTATMPALVFSNACQSARTEEWILGERFEDEIFGLANAFLLAGVRHYVGTFWEISDEPSSKFALRFYRNLLSGMTIGEAMRRSRLALIKEYGEETIIWASYVLYGDPTSNYRDQIESLDAQKAPQATRSVSTESEVRTREEVIDFADKEVKKRNRAWWSVSTIILLAAVILWGYPGFLKEGTAKYERAALAYYDEGNFKEALNVCRILEDKSPETCLTHLIRGNIYTADGKLDAAEEAYQEALQSTKGTNLQKAHALVGLGRIASFRKQPDAALRYYQQAAKAAPQSRLGYLSQALLLERKGDYDEAVGLFAKAQALAPEDQALAAVTNETRKKAAAARDKKKQERIDETVQGLLAIMKSPPKTPPADGWTSSPLTMWVMDFNVQGYPLQEGQERLLVSGMTDQILQHSHAQLVERALFDRLVEELKLGTSELIDPSTALSLGRILAAKLILSGQIIYSGPQVQVSMRLIETETGRIAATVTELFGSAVPASVLAERLSKNLLEKLTKLYPLRGKISKVQGEKVSLNIGQVVGVRTGQRFKVRDEDVTLEVTSTQKDASLAKILQGIGFVKEGQRVEVES